jgi:tRNA nucleotidyltransferase (CCA-adding enzyme)
MALKKVLKEVLEKVSLSREETDKLNEISKKIISELRNVGFNANVGGSLAKGTMIKKNPQDVDVFVTFRDENEISRLSDFLDKSDLEIKKIHGSRDYYHILMDGIIIELIPVIEFSEPREAKNVTDFSLLHVKYIKKRISANKKLADEIKLAKTFCHANLCYGAESYIKGFSGYALELLVDYYCSFERMLKGLSKAKIPCIIDSGKKLKNPLKELNESKILSPVIIIDPTFKFRNAAAGLSNETFGRFVSAARAFLKNPSTKFFEETKFNEDKFKKNAMKKKARYLKILLTTEKQEGDIAATKMKKFFDFIVREFERREQKVIESNFSYPGGQSAIGYLAVKEKKAIEIRGPPVKMDSAVKNFKKENKNTFVKKGFVYSKKTISLKDILLKVKHFEKEMDVSVNWEN